MQLSTKGAELIHSFEELRLVAYQDQKGVWTIGWGHTAGVKPGDTCSTYQAMQWFMEDSASAVNAVNISLTQQPTQNQFDALVSFTFNVGVGAEEHSTLCRLFNAGDIEDAQAEFGKWVHVNGEVNEGLVNRRNKELELFKS